MTFTGMIESKLGQTRHSPMRWFPSILFTCFVLIFTTRFKVPACRRVRVKIGKVKGVVSKRLFVFLAPTLLSLSCIDAASIDSRYWGGYQCVAKFKAGIPPLPERIVKVSHKYSHALNESGMRGSSHIALPREPGFHKTNTNGGNSRLHRRRLHRGEKQLPLLTEEHCRRYTGH